MSDRPDRLRALAASIRLPNLPSVWCNTLTGVLLAGIAMDGGWGDFLVIKLGCVLTAATCLYLAGNLLNDWADRHWDSTHRPERALPSGLFTPEVYLTLAICLLVIAWTAAGIASFPTLFTSFALSAAIGIYTWMHKRSAWSVIPMALCRALLPVMGVFSIVSWNDTHLWPLLYAAPLFTYLIMLSAAARAEAKADTKPSRMAMLGLLLPPALWVSIFLIAKERFLPAALISTMPFLLWIGITLAIYRKPVSRLVSALLAGIPFVDAMILITLLYTYSEVPYHWIWIPAFVLGRLLQRIVPAT